MKKLVRSRLFRILVVCVVVIGGVGLGISRLLADPKIEDHSYLVVDIHGEILEFHPPTDMAGKVLGGDPETLHRILANLEKATVDDRIDGVILKLSANHSAGLAKLEEIRGAVHRVRESGKNVVGWADSLDRNTTYLAAACDEVRVPPSAYIQFTGFAATTLYVKGTLDKLGIKPNLSKIKDYKSAAEMVTREDMSDFARENKEWLLDETWELFIEALGTDRGLTEEQIVAAMERAVMTADEAVALGLVDEVLYWDELETKLKQTDDDRLRTVSQSRYAKVERSELDLDGKKTIAVVHAQGLIGGRKSRVNPILGVMMGSDSVVADLARAREDDDVVAVVFRVDSRGGDGLTSDLIGHEVEVVAGVKPIVVSMVDAATSGGYSISYRASAIVADPMTLTGSIGSISAKFNMAGFYDTVGLSHDSVTRGPMAELMADTRDFTDSEWQRFSERHWTDFNLWLEDVAEHRGMSFTEAELLAHGRVWTGRQAVANGLVDELGDLNRAIELAKELAEISAGEKVSLVHYPESKGMLSAIFGDDDEVSAASWMLYRFLHHDVAETMEFMVDPRFVVETVEIR